MPKLTKEQKVAEKRAEEARRGLPSQHDDDKAHHRVWKQNTLEKQDAAMKSWAM
jgi:hypothetical protein